MWERIHDEVPKRYEANGGLRQRASSPTGSLASNGELVFSHRLDPSRNRLSNT